MTLPYPTRNCNGPCPSDVSNNSPSTWSEYSIETTTPSCTVSVLIVYPFLELMRPLYTTIRHSLFSTFYSYNCLMHYDLCLPWYWEFDIDFVHFVEHACHEQG